MKNSFLIYVILFSFSLHAAEQSVTFDDLRERITKIQKHTFVLQFFSLLSWKEASSRKDKLRAQVFYRYYAQQAQAPLILLQVVDYMQKQGHHDALSQMDHELTCLEDRMVREHGYKK